MAVKIVSSHEGKTYYPGVSILGRDTDSLATIIRQSFADAGIPIEPWDEWATDLDIVVHFLDYLGIYFEDNMEELVNGYVDKYWSVDNGDYDAEKHRVRRHADIAMQHYADEKDVDESVKQYLRGV